MVPMGSALNYHIEDNYSLICISGRLDISLSEKFSLLLDDNLYTDGLFQNKNIILNLKNLEYISSTGIRILLNIHKELKRNKKKLILCELKHNIVHVIELLELTGVFNIEKTKEKAIKKAS